eukprot:scaffold44599_cov42-Attheya_sp.AAC.2
MAMDKMCAACSKTAGDGLIMTTENDCDCCDCQKAHGKAHTTDSKQSKQEQNKVADASEKTGTQVIDYRKAFDDFVPLPIPDCPICYVTMPLSEYDIHMDCCGQVICHGCRMRVLQCAFCRAHRPRSDSEILAQLNKRVKINDAVAITRLALYYYTGHRGLPQDQNKAFELYQRASTLGCPQADFILAFFYYKGLITTKDMEKAKEYLTKADNGGIIQAGYWLGDIKKSEENIEAAVFHYRVAASAGMPEAIDEVKELFKDHRVSKDELDQALASCHTAQEATRSKDREEFDRLMRERDEWNRDKRIPSHIFE